MNRKNCFLSSLLASVILMVASTSLHAQTNSVFDKLKQPVKNIHLKQVTITQAISQISGEYQIPIGIETMPQQNDLKADIDMENGTLRRVMDLLIQYFPNNKWIIEDDVINISPKVKQENILDVKVRRYQTNDRLELDLRRSTTQLPGVIARMKELGVEPFHVAIGSLNGWIMPKTFSLELRNVTVRQILNELAKNSFNKYWVLSRGGDNGELLMIFL